MIKKIILYSILVFVCYKGAQFYSVYKLRIYMMECDMPQNLCELKAKKASGAEIISTLNKGYQCTHEKQSGLEKYIFPVPKELYNLENSGDISYKDLDGKC